MDELPEWPHAGSGQARFHDDIFQTSPNGLLRHRGSERPVKLFPQ
jgi:hypothetical protein